jgi:hypothetical protein
MGRIYSIFLPKNGSTPLRRNVTDDGLLFKNANNKTIFYYWHENGSVLNSGRYLGKKDLFETWQQQKQLKNAGRLKETFCYYFHASVYHDQKMP